MNADQIIRLLMATRHSKDLCVPECKDGPSQGRAHRRFDLWVMKRSYSKPACIGYEVKVSRGDFLSDNKWQDYLPLCNELYFVCPWGLIQPHEVPGDVGLLWCSKNLTTTYVKSKSSHRMIESPVDLMTYILMSRCKVTAPYDNSHVDRETFCRDWLDRKQGLAKLGYDVGRAIARQSALVAMENDALKRENESLREVKEFWCESLGCRSYELRDKYSSAVARQNERKLKSLESVIGNDLIIALHTVAGDLKRIESVGKQFQEKIKEVTS